MIIDIIDQSLEPGVNKTSKHEYTPLQIAEYHQNTTAGPMRPSSPVPAVERTYQPASQAQPTSQAQPAPTGYVPKQGKMTIADVEEEIEQLMERMKFLENTLQELKIENEKNL